MPIFSWEALVFIVTTATVYSAPSPQKLEDTQVIELTQKLEDSSSSEGYLSNDAPLRQINKESSEANGFGGYIFDEKICKIIHNRILCGYDRNKVENIENEVVDIGNGCFIRNDRIECGYFTKGNPDYLRLRSLTEVNDIINTTPTVTSSNIKHEEINIFETAITTMSLPESDTSESTTRESTDLLKTSSQESNIGTEQVETSSDTILSTTLLKPVSSNNSLTATSIKENDSTTSSSSTLLNLIANLTINKIVVANHDTDLEKQSEVGNTTVPILHILKRSIEQIRYEKASPKCPKCPLRISETDPTTFSPADINTPVVYSSRANMDIKYLRYNSDKARTKTACIEKDDRIVCYNYKAI